jgi:IS5 family transposase
MIKKKHPQMSFASLQVDNCVAKTNWLKAVNRIIDWKPIENILADIHPARRGRPAYDPVFMFKILLLQQWFNLSDPQAEAMINDRISFKLFLGMDIAETGPDETTICRFRNELGHRARMLFEEVNRQFLEKGIIVRTGTITDASFIQSAAKPRKRKQSKDKDATWGHKGKKSVFGYKMHIGTDMDSGILRKTTLTTAKVHDSQVMKKLISGDEELVAGDKAYFRIQWEDYIEIEGKRYVSWIMKKAFRNRPLSKKDKERNKFILPGAQKWRQGSVYMLE